MKKTWCYWLSSQIHRARDPCSRTLHDVRVNHRGGNFRVAQQVSDHSYVNSTFEEVGGKGMAKRVAVVRFAPQRTPACVASGHAAVVGFPSPPPYGCPKWVVRFVNCGFCSARGCKQSEDGSWTPLYMAQTRDLRQRLESFEKQDLAIRNGATHIHVHIIPEGKAARCDEEQDLILNW